MRLLVDTDVAIDYLRGQGYARRLMERLWQEGEAYLSAVTVYELHSAGTDSAVEALIGACRVLGVDEAVARAAAGWYRRWRAEGITLTTADCLVAGTALAHRVRVATRNIRHFPDPALRLELPGEFGDP